MLQKALVALCVGVVAGVFTAIVHGQESHTDKSLRLAADSLLIREQFPQRALLLAREAVVVAKSSHPALSVAEQVLIETLSSAGGEPLGGAGEDKGVAALAITKDGNSLFTGGYDHNLHRWILAAGHPGTSINSWKGHSAAIVDLCVSPDEKWALTAGDNERTALLWHLEDQDPSQSVVRLTAEQAVRAVAINDNWAAVGCADGKIRVWKRSPAGVVPQSVVLEGHTKAILDLEFIPGSRWLASAGTDATARLWDLNAGEPAKTSIVLAGHRGSVLHLAASSDGKILVSASDDSTARLWFLTLPYPNLDSCELRGHTGPVRAVGISPDGQWVATGSDDASARLWDLSGAKTSGYRSVLRGHTGSINALAFSDDGKWLATGASDSTARVWRLSRSDPADAPLVFKGHERPIRLVAFAGDFRRLVTAGDDGARLWDVKDSGLGAPSYEIPGLGPVLSPNGGWLFSQIAPDHGELRKLSALDQVAVPQAIVGQGPIVRAPSLFSPDSNWLIVSGETETAVRSIDPSGAGAPRRLHGPSKPIDTLAVSPDSHWLAAGGQDRSVYVWKLDAGSDEMKAQHSHKLGSPVRAVAISKGGRLVVVATEDKKIWLWEPSKNPKAIPDMQDAVSRIELAEIANDGWWLAGSSDHDLRLWHVPDLHSEMPPKPHSLPSDGASAHGNVRGFALAGKWLAALTKDRVVRVYHLTREGSKEPPLELYDDRPAHMPDEAFYALTVSPDRHWLASYSDGSVFLWDMEHGAPELSRIRVRLPSRLVDTLKLSLANDRHWLAVELSRRGIESPIPIPNGIQLWNLHQSDLLERAEKTAGRKLTPKEVHTYGISQ